MTAAVTLVSARVRDPDTLRMQELLDWLKPMGICHLCATGLAIFAIEREAGRTYDWVAVRGECRRQGASGRTCLERARSAWATLPRRPPRAAPRAGGLQVISGGMTATGGT